MMTVLPAAELLTTSSNKALVPAANFSNSKTPGGPFQTMVLAFATVAANNFLDSGPLSNPCQPAGIPSLSVTVLVLASAEKASAMMKSTGKTTSTPLALAFSINFGTISAPALSKMESPISVFSKTFLKVKAIPPPMMIESTLSNKLSIN
ncbi:hypothetical protein AWRI1631_30710 [Saccharomyces cerevisiae AWRI1631]|nr:hypothetical protein AWRI1631_30710 [Saccharomyces cerevisiae AWRI1631]